MINGYWEDDQREEGTLTDVEGPDSRGWYSVRSSSGWSCGVDGAYGVVPIVGDRFITWGGFGFPIRGQMINDRLLYYRTPAEQDVENAKYAEKSRAERIAEYESKRSEFDARVAALPAPLRERVEAFRAFNPTWRWEFESYELGVCEEAQRLAARFPTSEALTAFAKLGHAEQKAAHPEMYDGHSGNSWGASIRFAHLLITWPETLLMEHGALCPLVGCRQYGCHSYRSTVTPSAERL